MALFGYIAINWTDSEYVLETLSRLVHQQLIVDLLLETRMQDRD
jgi:hypothetical protein